MHSGKVDTEAVKVNQKVFAQTILQFEILAHLTNRPTLATLTKPIIQAVFINVQSKIAKNPINNAIILTYGESCPPILGSIRSNDKLFVIKWLGRNHWVVRRIDRGRLMRTCCRHLLDLCYQWRNGRHLRKIHHT